MNYLSSLHISFHLDVANTWQYIQDHENKESIDDRCDTDFLTTSKEARGIGRAIENIVNLNRP